MQGAVPVPPPVSLAALSATPLWVASLASPFPSGASASPSLLPHRYRASLPLCVHSLSLTHTHCPFPLSAVAFLRPLLRAPPLVPAHFAKAANTPKRIT